MAASKPEAALVPGPSGVHVPTRSPDDYDYLLKLALVGDSGVGKTQLLNRFCSKNFELQSKTTIGVEFATQNVELDGDQIKLQIWDTAGQERYRAITTAYYRGAAGGFVVFDITRRASFTNMNAWLQELRDHASPDIVILLVGNKCDLAERRAVDAEEGKALADKEGCYYMETSALDGTNVGAAFAHITRRIYDQVKRSKLEEESEEEVPSVPAGRTIHVRAEVALPPPAKSSCCA